MRYYFLIIALLYAVGAQADDVISMNFKLYDDNWLEDALFTPPNHGSQDSLVVGQRLNEECRSILMYGTATYQDEIDSINAADSSIGCSCSLQVDESVDLAVGDSAVLFMVKVTWDEMTSDWEDSSGTDDWNGEGCGGSGTDRYVFRVETKRIDDLSATDWLVFDCKPALDSIVAHGYKWKGWLVQMNNESGNDHIIFYSTDVGDPALHPRTQWDYAYLTPPAGDATTDRHGADRHGAIRH